MRAKYLSGLFAFLILAIPAFSQGPPDCQFSVTFTSATAGQDYQNSGTPCVAWRVTYFAEGLSGVALQFEGAPDANGTPGTYVAIPTTQCSTTVQPPCTAQGTNPLTDTQSQTAVFSAYTPWVRLNVTTFTTVGGPPNKLVARVYGYKGTSAASNGTGGGSGGGGFANPMTTLGDMIYGDVGGVATRLAGNNTTTLKVLTQTGDGVNSAAPSWQVPPSPGTLTYYLTPTASDIATDLQMTTTPFSPFTTLTYAAIPIGTTTFQDWATQPGFPGLSFIPAGTFEWHVHASNGGGGNAKLRAQFWEVSATGVDIGMIGQTEETTILTGSETEYRVFFTTANVYTMASINSRIVCRAQAIVSGFAATVLIDVGDEADSHISLPSNTVDATNFVPYIGATKNVALGTNTLVGANVALTNNVRAIGASFDGGGSPITLGKTAYFTVPYPCTISAWNITVDTGTATIDVWKIATGTAIPTVANSITAGAPPAISVGTAIHSTSIPGWTVAVAQNDIFGISVTAVSGATLASLILQCNQ